MNIDFKDPKNPIVKVVEREDYVEKPEKDIVVTFGDSDMDNGLLTAENVGLLKSFIFSIN